MGLLIEMIHKKRRDSCSGVFFNLTYEMRKTDVVTAMC